MRLFYHKELHQGHKTGSFCKKSILSNDYLYSSIMLYKLDHIKDYAEYQHQQVKVTLFLFLMYLLYKPSFLSLKNIMLNYLYYYLLLLLLMEFTDARSIENASSTAYSINNNMDVAYPPDHMSLSTTSSLTRQLDSANVSIIRRVAVEHNKSSCLSIQCEATGDYFPIPFCGVDRNSIINGRKKNFKAWWSRYGYGLRVGMNIYCIVNRRDVNGCRAVFQSKGGVLSSFLLHLSSQSNSGHKVDELKRK